MPMLLWAARDNAAHYHHMLILTALLSLSLVQTNAAPVRTITIAVDDTMNYSVTAITAKPGETLRVVVKSSSTLPKAAMAHNFVLLAAGPAAAGLVRAALDSRDTGFIPPAHRSQVLAASALAGSRATVEVTFKAPAQPGVYDFICSFPGHYALGMKGTLTVK
jgi:azurin